MKWERRTAMLAAVAPAASIRERRVTSFVSGFAWAIAMARARRVFLFIAKPHFYLSITIQQNGLPVKLNLGTALPTCH
jgi:hypothetical protein